MTNYRLNIHSWDVGFVFKHTGFELEELDNYGNLLKTYTIDLDESSSGNIIFNINTYEASEYKSFMEIKQVITGENALDIFNRIKIEADILNQLSSYLDFNLIMRNCNASTAYFAEKYIPGYANNGSAIFNLFNDGLFVGDEFIDFDFDSTVKKVSDTLYRYYSLVDTVDLSTVVADVQLKSDGWYLKISDNKYSYIFDDNGASSINDSENIKNSIIYLGEGHNVVHSGSGNDTIYGGGDIDSIVTGRGDSIVYTYGGNDVVNTGGSITEDTNYVYLGDGSDKYNGGIGKDIVDGGSREDKNTDINEIDLGFGDDEYRGGIGKDIVNGGSGIDKIYAGDGNNNINGGIGNDTIAAGKDNDIIYGGTGRNFISAGSGNNEIHCDINSENLININSSSGVDKIYNSKNTSYIYFYNGISRIETVNKDIIVYGRSGNIAILYGAAESEDENDKPKLYDEDGGIYGWDPQSGGYKKGDDKVPGIKEAIDNQSFDEFQEKKEIGENIPEDIYKDLSEDQLGNLRDLLYEDYLNGINGDGEGCGRRAKYGLSDMRRIIGSYLINSDFSLGMDRDAIRRIMNRDIIRGDPLVLDLDGDGVEFRTDKGYYFDLDGDGLAENINWISSDDAFLVHDSNRNGKVDGIEELFGNMDMDGYDELIKYDTNNDRKINSEDKNYNILRVL